MRQIWSPAEPKNGFNLYLIIQITGKEPYLLYKLDEVPAAGRRSHFLPILDVKYPKNPSVPLVNLSGLAQ